MQPDEPEFALCIVDSTNPCYKVFPILGIVDCGDSPCHEFDREIIQIPSGGNPCVIEPNACAIPKIKENAIRILRALKDTQETLVETVGLFVQPEVVSGN